MYILLETIVLMFFYAAFFQQARHEEIKPWFPPKDLLHHNVSEAEELHKNMSYCK